MHWRLGKAVERICLESTVSVLCSPPFLEEGRAGGVGKSKEALTSANAQKTSIACTGTHSQLKLHVS